MAFGVVDLRAHLLMLGFSTHDMRPLIIPPHLPLHMLTKKGEKRKSYEQRIREIEHASFVPAVFATTGGMYRITVNPYVPIFRGLDVHGGRKLRTDGHTGQLQ